MTTFKLDVSKLYGKLRFQLYEATAKAPEPTGSYGTVQEMLAAVKEALDASYQKGDTVVFRGVGYGSRSELRGIMLHAPY